jgi:curved DNA-binding protein CbpA
MAPRPMLPPDDLYARLELPVDASYEAIEIAWRALLKQHHPDVAGPAADHLAKRINVAHDWLSDPDLRARYDRERHPRRSGVGGDRSMAGRRSSAGSAGGARSSVRAARPVRRPVEPAEAIARHVDRIRRLTEDELDRLSLAETAPIAFIATISRFLPKDRQEALRTLEPMIQDALPRRARWDPATRDAAVGYAQDILLGPFLDEHLSGDFRERVHERLTRGWEAAVDQPRYGPNTAAVAQALRRLEALPPGERARIAGTAPRAGVPAEHPWPHGLSPTHDDGLRVSSALAQRDALALLPEPIPAYARRALGRAMHGLVLRHGFKAAEVERLAGPWAPIVLPQAPAAAGARRR